MEKIEKNTLHCHRKLKLWYIPTGLVDNYNLLPGNKNSLTLNLLPVSTSLHNRLVSLIITRLIATQMHNYRKAWIFNYRGKGYCPVRISSRFQIEYCPYTFRN